MSEDYYEEATVSFPIEKWLTHHDDLNYDDNSGDYEGYVYWAKNSDRCVMAKVKGKFSDYKLENITKELPHYNPVDVATYAKKRIESELVSLVPRPEDQNIKLLSQKICNSIQDEIVKMAERLTKIDVKDITQHDLSRLNRDLFEYIPIWTENGGDEALKHCFIDLNDQSWFALTEKMDKSKDYTDRIELVNQLKDFLDFVKKS